jgi:hypothetical protein
MEKDQSIKKSTLNCPSKRLRKRLWAVLGGYRWRRSQLVSWCRARLPIVFCPSGDSNTHQRYIKFVYNLCLVQFKSHTRSFCVLDDFFWIYTLVTSIKSQQWYQSNWLLYVIWSWPNHQVYMIVFVLKYVILMIMHELYWVS